MIVDFWAEWCGPCKQMLPIFETFAEGAKDRVVCAKVNVDESADIAGEYGVMSIPTLVVFKDGEALESLVGVQDQAGLDALLEKYS